MKNIVSRSLVAAVFIFFLGASATVFSQTGEGGLPAVPDVGVKITGQSKPEYTEKARKRGVEGSVRLNVEFLASGEIGKVTLSSESSKKKKLSKYGLVDQAIAAARKVKFIPAMKDGKAITVTKTVEFNFNLF